MTLSRNLWCGVISCHGLASSLFDRNDVSKSCDTERRIHQDQSRPSQTRQFAFATPLATLHKFNGFADVFLVTPPTGIEDYYVDVTYKVHGIDGPLSFLNGLLLKGRYHDFSSDVGSINYGEEFDIYAKLPLGRGFYAETKYANYNADQFAVDTEKFIFGFGYRTKFTPFVSK